jgi:beta-lactamase superfamily II metal-dependent hydrolase
MFRIELLPAQRGDALWISYGEPARHVLVDAGPSETIGTLVPELERRIRALPRRTDAVELLITTHIDADHIQGIVSLLSDPARLPQFRDIWFNSFQHLAPGLLGGPDGEQLTRILERAPERWNKAFGGEAVVLPETGPLTIALDGGLEIVLLSPTAAGLAKLVPKWEEECRKAGLLPGHGAEVPRSAQREGLLGFDIDTLAAARYGRDRAEANGSSIAFVAKFEGKSVLCAADAHSEVMEQSLDALGPGPHKFTAVKISHHGSKANISPKFLERVRSRNWLVSTNGANFKHPHGEALARIVTTQPKPVFHLNYVMPHMQDLIDGAGERYSVKLPRKRRDGTFEEGIVFKLA